MAAEISRISIIGAGALGALYGAKFFDMDPKAVAYVARGARARRLRESGLRVNGRHYRPRVLDADTPDPPPDLVMVAVKHDALPAAIEDLRPHVGSDTLFLSVMNGIESEERLAAAFGKENVLYAVAVGMDAVREENRVSYSQIGKLLFGWAKNPVMDGTLRRIQSLFDRAEIPWEIPPDMLKVLWWKYMINVGINQASAVMEVPYGVFQTSKDACGVMESAMREVVAIANRQGVPLEEADIRNWYSLLATLSPDGKTSMYQDIEAGRKTEVEMFAGKLVELGEAEGISTPVNRTLLGILRVKEQTRRPPKE